MADIFDRKAKHDVFVARSGADIIVGHSAADGDSAPGRSHGYIVDGEAGLDWLFGGSAGETLDSAQIIPLYPDVDDDRSDDDIDRVLVRRRRSRRGTRRRS